MQTIPSGGSSLNFVRAMFEDGISTFVLPRGATFEDLADRLGSLAEDHRGHPQYLRVRVADPEVRSSNEV
jgi:hypothetical protein